MEQKKCKRLYHKSACKKVFPYLTPGEAGEVAAWLDDQPNKKRIRFTGVKTTPLGDKEVIFRRPGKKTFSRKII